MGKYIPDPHEDMWSTRPCFICGRDVLDEDSNTCSENCAALEEMYQQDIENIMLNDFINPKEEEDGI